MIVNLTVNKNIVQRKSVQINCKQNKNKLINSIIILIFLDNKNQYLIIWKKSKEYGCYKGKMFELVSKK